MDLLQCLHRGAEHALAGALGVAVVHGHRVDAGQVDPGLQELRDGGGAVARQAGRCDGQGEPDRQRVTGVATLALQRGDGLGASLARGVVRQVVALDVVVDGADVVAPDDAGVGVDQVVGVRAGRGELVVRQTAEGHADLALLLLQAGDAPVEVELVRGALHGVVRPPARTARGVVVGDHEGQHDVAAPGLLTSSKANVGVAVTSV